MPEMCLYSQVRLDAAGRIAELVHSNHKVVFSADGRRLHFAGSDEWWSRDPVGD
jgi:hypothetical protein